MKSMIYSEVVETFKTSEPTENYFTEQFNTLLNQQGLDSNNLDIDQLRTAVASLLQDVLLDLKNECEK